MIQKQNPTCYSAVHLDLIIPVSSLSYVFSESSDSWRELDVQCDIKDGGWSHIVVRRTPVEASVDEVHIWNGVIPSL
jgi:hypothetical protein